MPVETWLGWAVAWGGLPPLLFERVRIAPLVLGMLAWDLVAMPRLGPLLVLSERWWIGEALALALVLAPSLCLARLTLESRAVRTRAALQAVAFSGLVFFLLPVVAHDRTQSFFAWIYLLGPPPPWAFALAGPWVALGLAAVGEFAERGGGTPLPLDPPRALVITGPYAFVRNPMQVAAPALLLIESLWLESAWLALAALASVVYSLGFAASDERGDLPARFGADYAHYRTRVRAWLPHWRPRRETAAVLYFGAGCDVCEGFARGLARFAPRALELVPAAQHPSRSLTRLTYRDGNYEVSGVRAIARALEHCALPLALLGFTLRAPFVTLALQLIIDASGGGPRKLPVSSVR